MDGFLGIHILRNKVINTITMTKTGLIDRILQAIDMMNANAKYVPADKEPGHKDLGWDIYCEEYEYRYMVGMMLYLTGSTRLDIAYDMHQYTHCSHNPKRSHEVGVKCIAR